MRKAVVCSLALLTAVAVRPASAGNVYVPIVERNAAGGATLDTEVLVSNGGLVQRSFVSTFLGADTDGTKRDGVPSNSRVRMGTNTSFRLRNAAPADRHGMLEVDAAPQLLIDAHIQATGQGGLSTTRLPVISSDNMIAAKGVADVLGLERQTGGAVFSDFSVVNLAKSSAQCDVKLFRANGSQLSTATITLSPLSLRRFGDVLASEQAVSDVRAQVSCNKDFYAFGTLYDSAHGRIAFAEPSASGASTLVGPTGGTTEPPPPPPATGSSVFSAPGVQLVPAKGHEVREYAVPVSKALALRRMVIDMDFTVGPWFTHNNSGPHAIIWLYRGSFRSNTIANVNVHGPNKNKIRMNQNVDLPGVNDTLAEQGFAYQVGTTYHFNYIYDAENRVVRVRVTGPGGAVANSFNFPASALNRTLTMPASGYNIVLGHRAGLEFEVPSYGWTYSNLRVEMVPY